MKTLDKVDRSLIGLRVFKSVGYKLS